MGIGMLADVRMSMSYPAGVQFIPNPDTITLTITLMNRLPTTRRASRL